MSDVYILTKGEKNINVGKNENVELPHSQVVDYVCFANKCIGATDTC